MEVHDAAESALRTLGRVVEEHVVAGVGDLVPLVDVARSLREGRAALRVVRPSTPDPPGQCAAGGCRAAGWDTKQTVSPPGVAITTSG